MKIVKLLLSVTFLGGILYACEKSDSGSKIGLEENNITFRATGDSTIVKTQNDYWGISEVYEYITADSAIIHGELINKDTISINWFTIIKLDKAVFVKATPNNTGKKRDILLILSKGNYTDQLVVDQEKQ